jgi:UDP-glucose 6-dehydrogenase
MKKTGFIGIGWIGKSLSDNFKERGYDDLVLYSQEEPYVKNKEEISLCDYVFVAVPTPTTPEGFDGSILFKVVPLTKPGSVVIIKSTVPGNILRTLQTTFDDRVIIHCPEFLTESTAKHDTDYPERNIMGVSDVQNGDLRALAREVLEILPPALYEDIVSYEDSAMIKYSTNCFFYIKNMFFNVLFDMVEAQGGNWNKVRRGVVADSRIHPVHTQPVHKGGRGAGNHCLIKDFATLVQQHEHLDLNVNAREFLEAAESWNILLLNSTHKDLDLVEGVYGSDAVLTDEEYGAE